MRMHVLRCSAWAVLSAATVAWLGIDVPTVAAAESETMAQRESAGEVQRDMDRPGLRRGGEGEGLRQRPPQRLAVQMQEVKRELEKATAELQELRAQGGEEAAMQKKRQVQELERQMERMERVQRGDLRAPLDDRPAFRGREMGPRPPMEGPELERKLRHLQAAIENLHAAGMHEPAERLAQQAEMMRSNVGGRQRDARPPGAPGAEVQRLQSEVQELRRAVGELKARVEDLARDTRGR